MSDDFSKELKRYNYLLSETAAVYHDASSKLGLPDSSLIVLYTILDTGDPCPLQNICRNAGISKQTVNSALRRLEAKGILYLENADAKNKTVHLTREGQKLAKATAGKIIKLENDIFSSWTQQDVNQYLALSERYLHDFKSRLDRLQSF